MLTLMNHQLRGVMLARERPRYGFFFDPGTGKTITLLSIIAERPIRTCIVCPKAIIDDAWLSDAKHFPSIRVVSARAKSPHERKTIIAGGQWDAIAMNPELFKIHLSDLLRIGIKRLVVDESSMLKNYRSQITKAVIDASRHVSECYVLSGTPAPNGEHEYWAQLRCIAPAITDPSFFRWAHRYMYPQRESIRGQEVIKGWRMIPERAAEFASMLAQYSWSLAKQDCVDLPEKINVYRSVELSPDERRAYDSMRKTMAMEWDGHTIDAGTHGKLMKLRQICGGTVYHGEDRIFIGQSKLDALAEVAEEIGRRPFVVWAEFTSDIDRIAARLRAEGRVAEILDGRTADEDRRKYIAALGRGVDALVCHAKAVGHGITLVQASYAVYYSYGFSPETYSQSIDRIHRVGQKNKCTYIHLVAANTCDQQIIAVVTRKMTASDALREILRTDGLTKNKTSVQSSA